jgi:hypothetical protein
MGWTSQFVAGERVERASPEEESADHEEGDVEHEISPVCGIRAYRPEVIRSASNPPGKHGVNDHRS